MQEERKNRGGISLDEALVASEKWDREPKAEKAELYLTIPPKELVFWALFSAGGMVSAFLIPIHVVILGIAFAAGWLSDDALSYQRVLDLARHPLAKVYLGILVVMPLYHWAHRFRYAVHHLLGIHGWQRLVATLCYGTAIVGTALTVWVLLRI
ncbi:MAG: fumarate reductase subunit FrdD [Actinomycetota bacterium]